MPVAERLQRIWATWDVPLLRHEMRVRQRGARPFVVMFVYAAVLCVVAMVVLYTSSAASGSHIGYGMPQAAQWIPQRATLQSEAMAKQGRELFKTLSLAQLAMILLIVPAYSSGSVSGERERGTFDSLALTLLSSSSIIIQKMTAAMAQALVLIVASVPVLAVVFFYGGVSPMEVVMVYALLVFSAGLLCALGMFCSCVWPNTRTSTFVAYIAAVVALLGVPLIGNWLEGTAGHGLSGLTDSGLIIFTLMFAFAGGVLSLIVYGIAALVLHNTTELWRARVFRMCVFGAVYAALLLILSVPALTDAAFDLVFHQGVFLPLYVNPFFAISNLVAPTPYYATSIAPRAYYGSGHYVAHGPAPVSWGVNSQTWAVTATIIFAILCINVLRQSSTYRLEALRRY